jgi:threonine 3-dehydrogenase
MDYPRFIAEGLPIGPVLTHHFPIEEFQHAFDVMASGQAGKVVLDWR